VYRSIALAVAVLSFSAAAAVSLSTNTHRAEASQTSRSLLVGIYDEPSTIGRPTWAFPRYRALRVKVLRVNLYWGDLLGAARVRRPARPTDPADPAYNWWIYDQTVRRAQQNGIRIVFSILFTPRWAAARRNHAPRRMADLRNFAIAAARRYSGTYIAVQGERPLPAVRYWLAWNEPNNPVFLSPQFRRVRGGRYAAWSPRIYSQMCNAIYSGVKAVSRANKVGCGVTAPRGNNAARSSRPSISPIYFARGMNRWRARYDAYAHHPYYGHRLETPTSRPRVRGSTAVLLGNINDLVRVIGRRRLWITEYGFQTRPERIFPVSFAQQARYVSQSFAIARRHPRIDMMLWFLLRDDPRIGNGWQSGFFTVRGRAKPSYRAFQRVRK
jgi:hypothetical protein